MKAIVRDLLLTSELNEAHQRAVREWADEALTGPHVTEEKLEALKARIEQAKTEQARETADPTRQLLDALDAAFFGTLMPRDPDAGVLRTKHAKDGWRDGVSHPLRVTVTENLALTPDHKMLLRVCGVTAPGVATFDVLEDASWTRRVYAMLRIGILTQAVRPAP